ncbi:MAG TPA: GNAT family N-acetyltransferase [Thermoanaerobaculia bacterium]|nr:GNAT family N-acetyltransferase [Thermoanaerobaculia bacterium]
MIRKATPVDLPAIAGVMQASFASLGVGFYDEAQLASAIRYIAVPDRQLVDDGTYFVAVEEERIVACGGWSARTKLFSGPASEDAAEGWLDPFHDAARVRAMFVDPEYSRRGLGRLILQASEADAAHAGFTRFELMATLPGVPLYRTGGYEAVEEVTVELPDGVRLMCVRMRRFGVR